MKFNKEHVKIEKIKHTQQNYICLAKKLYPSKIEKRKRVYKVLFSGIDNSEEININKFLMKNKLRNIISPNKIYHLSHDCVGDSYMLKYKDVGTTIHDTIIQKKDKKKYMLDLIEGLEELHNNSIWHMDIKTTNVIIHENTAKFIDFGMSCFSPEYSKSKRFYNRCTYLYSSPESLLNLKCNSSHDIWSLSHVFYYIMFKSYPILESEEKKTLIKIFNINGIPYKSDFKDLEEYIDYLDSDNNKRKFKEIRENVDYLDSDKFKSAEKIVFYGFDKFEDLFNKMTKMNPKNRITLKEVKGIVMNLEETDFN